MIPNWLLVALSLTTMVVFVTDYGAQFFVAGHTASSPLTGVFGTVCGLAFALARSNAGRKNGKNGKSGGDKE